MQAAWSPGFEDIITSLESQLLHIKQLLRILSVEIMVMSANRYLFLKVQGFILCRNTFRFSFMYLTNLQV